MSHPPCWAVHPLLWGLYRLALFILSLLQCLLYIEGFSPLCMSGRCRQQQHLLVFKLSLQMPDVVGGGIACKLELVAS